MSYEDEPMDQEEDEDFRKPDEVPAKLRLPAIFLIIVGVLNVLGGLYFVANGIIVMSNPQSTQWMKQFTQQEPTPQEMKVWGVFYLVLGFLGLIAAALTILGGSRMAFAKSYGLAIVASMLAIIPGISCMGCCGIGEGIGIWSLIVLMSADVKAAFR